HGAHSACGKIWRLHERFDGLSHQRLRHCSWHLHALEQEEGGRKRRGRRQSWSKAGSSKVKRAAVVLLCVLASTAALAQSKTPERQTAPAPKASAVTLPCDPLNLLPGCVSAAGVTSDGSNSGDLWAKIVN